MSDYLNKGVHDLSGRLARYAGHEVTYAVKSTRRNIMLYAVAGLFGATAYVGALMALFIYMARLWDPLISAGILAGGTLLIAVLIISIVKIMQARDRRKARINRASRALAASGVAAALPLLAKSRSPVAVLAMGGAAFLLSRLIPEEMDR